MKRRRVYDPEKTATLAMQRTDQTTGAQPVAAGVPGTASNAPNTQALPVYPRETAPPQTAKSESEHLRRFENGEAHGGESGPRAAADRGHCGQRPDDSSRRKNHAASGSRVRPRAAQPDRSGAGRSGFDTARGDLLTVQDLAFDGNRAEPPSLLSEQVLNAARARRCW